MSKEHYYDIIKSPVITEKSIVLPSIRGGVPVLSRPTGSWSSRSREARVVAGGSPARPAG